MGIAMNAGLIISEKENCPDASDNGTSAPYDADISNAETYISMLVSDAKLTQSNERSYWRCL
jgi:hypothetical protein